MDIQIYKEFPNEIDKKIKIKELLFVDLEESLQGDELVYNYVHYVNQNKLIRIPVKEQFRAIRLDRNRNLITTEQQSQLLEAKIGIAGMSVGYYALTCMAMEGIGGSFALYDGDVVSLSNLNRIPVSVFDVGSSKSALAKKKALHIDPYLEIEDAERGLEEGDLDTLFANSAVDVFIDEMDDLRMKVLVRTYAKKYGVPVVMVTGNNESVILDVERYDLEKDKALFNGSVADELIESILGSENDDIDPTVFSQLALQLVGKEDVDSKLLQSFELVGTELNGIPQLAETSFRRGFVLTSVVKKILLGEGVESGRYLYSYDPVKE